MNQPEQREEAVFEAALQLPADQRATYLDQACAADADLRRRVESLLGAFERAGGFLKQPATPERTVRFSLPPTEKPGDRIGRYKLLQQIGEGGCGMVYMAEQEEPVRRRVALKVIKLGMDTKSVIARFEAERQALAIMDHPNIAKVLDAGATEAGRPYFVMELVRGIKITDFCDQKNLSTRARLDLFIQVCRAVQHAHQKGIIHRDLKPSNILVTSDDGVPVPKVIDFGIAKATQGRLTDHTVFTAFEQFIGTPAYMSPEQAEMTLHDIDTRTDIYSLGVLLYELLTGRTPFDQKELLAAGLDEMRRTIREVEPVKPSTRLTQARLADPSPDSAASALRIPHSAIADDLDWIAMKCLEKDRARRYETANGLAADLARHLNNEPVVARPPSRVYEFQKTVRRHKFGFAAVAAILLVLAGGITLTTWQAIRATGAEREQARQRQRAEEAGATARQQEQLATKNEEEARRQASRASDQELIARRRFYAAQVNLAHQALEAGKPERTLELLENQRPKFDEEDLRTFEWYYLWGQCQSGLRATLRREPVPISRLAFSPDSKTLAIAAGEEVKLWDVATGRQYRTLREGRGGRDAVAFSPDGKWLATGGNMGQGAVWNLDTAEESSVHFLPGNRIERCVTFSPDGKTLAGGNFQGAITVWEVATWREIATIQTSGYPVESLAFSPDGKALAAAPAWGDHSTKLWDVSANPPKLIGKFPGERAVAFSPVGGRLASSSLGGRVGIFETATGQEVASHPGVPPWPAFSMAFSPDGTRLAFASQNHCAKIWNPATGEQQTFAHLSAVRVVAFSPDGRVFASGSEDGVVKLWDLARQRESPNSSLAKGSTSPVFSPDGVTLACVTPLPSVDLLDLATGKHRSIVAPASRDPWLLFSPDGKILACISDWWSYDNNVQTTLFDLASRKKIAQLNVSKIAFSPDGKSFAAADAKRPSVVQVWSLDTMQPRPPLVGVPASASALAFSPDGKVLAVGGQYGWVKLWDPATGELQTTLQAGFHGSWQWLGCLAFSRDGKFLAVGNWDGVVNLWDFRARRLHAALRGHMGAVKDVAFFPDGKTIVSMSEDRTLKFWDVETGQERLTLEDQADRDYSLGVSPDGATLASVANGGTVSLRRAVRDPQAIAFQNELDPDDVNGPVAQVNAGAQLWASGQPAAAEQLYRQAVPRLEQLSDRFPQQVELWEKLLCSQFALGVLSRSSQGLGVTNQTLRRALELHADQLDLRGAFAALAQPLARQGKRTESEQALRWAEQAVHTRTNYAAYWSGQGLAYYRAGQPQQAIDSLLQSWKLNSNGLMGRDLFILAMAHFKLGNSGKAETCRRDAVEWWQKRAVAQSASENEELERFGTECEQLLGTTNGWRWREPTAAGQTPLTSLESEQVGSSDPEFWVNIPPRPAEATPQMVDLTDHFHAALKETWHPGDAGNDLAHLPAGIQELQGVRFDIRGVVQLNGGGMIEAGAKSYPRHVEGIKVGCPCARLHFLHAAGWAVDDGTVVGRYVLHYSDGSSQALPIVYGEDTRDWWVGTDKVVQLKHAQVAWQGLTSSGNTVRIYKRTWENPHPEREVASLEFISNMTRCAPFLVAITVE